jgi:hypothetical protein
MPEAKFPEVNGKIVPHVRLTASKENRKPGGSLKYTVEVSGPQAVHGVVQPSGSVFLTGPSNTTLYTTLKDGVAEFKVHAPMNGDYSFNAGYEGDEIYYYAASNYVKLHVKTARAK